MSTSSSTRSSESRLIRGSFLVVALTAVVACGGKSADSDGQDAAVPNSLVCGILADSGLTCVACFANKCCAELSACIGNSDGAPYETCVTNCLTTNHGGSMADGGNSCSESCASQHPAGASACSPYLACGMAQCTSSC
jgi:hypothetical protein